MLITIDKAKQNKRKESLSGVKKQTNKNILSSVNEQVNIDVIVNSGQNFLNGV